LKKLEEKLKDKFKDAKMPISPAKGLRRGGSGTGNSPSFAIFQSSFADLERSYHNSSRSDLRSQSHDQIDLELNPNKILEPESFPSDFFHKERHLLETLEGLMVCHESKKVEGNLIANSANFQGSKQL
jgi:hypothetical protein